MQRPAFHLLTAIFACICLLFITASELRADSSKRYDLQSLVYLSTEIFEGDIRDRRPIGGFDVIEVRVNTSHKGIIEPGKTVLVIGTNAYRKTGLDEHVGQPLDVGEQLVLFLQPRQPEEHEPRDLPALYSPVTGGVRLIQGETAYNFQNLFGNGPYQAKSAFYSYGFPREQPLKKLRSDIKASLQQAPALAKLVEAKPDRLDLPRMLKQLATTSVDLVSMHNYINETICQRLAETHNLEHLSQALLVTKNHYELLLLYHGFCNPAGRDYLLAKLADKTQTNAARSCYAGAVRYTGGMYALVSTYRENEWQYAGEVEADNSHYLTRLAQAIQAVATDENTCVEVINALDKFAGWYDDHKSAALQTDMHSAMSSLQEFYKTKPAEEIQFAIEKALTRYPQLYEQLNSPCGDAIMLLRRSIFDRPEQHSGQTRRLDPHYSTVRVKRETIIRPTLVLLNLKTKKSQSFPTALKLEGMRVSHNGEDVPLPPSLPAGKYRVYLEWREGGKLLSTSHGYEVEFE